MRTLRGPEPLTKRLARWGTWLAVALLVIWAGTGVPLTGIATHGQAWGMLRRMIGEYETQYAGKGIAMMWETLEMALLGTLIAALLAIPFGFWAARNMSRVRVTSSGGKLTLNLIRTFPDLVVAILFISAVGPGPFAGVLTMGVHSIGMLGKLYAEAVEAIDRGPIEAIRATGASGFQVLWYGVLPQVFPEFASFAIYRFEINVRAAAILGFVGAGGIGAPLIFAIGASEWGRVSLFLSVIVVTVIVIDTLSSRLRSRLV